MISGKRAIIETDDVGNASRHGSSALSVRSSQDNNEPFVRTWITLV
jgi:hypothetical protein